MLRTTLTGAALLAAASGLQAQQSLLITEFAVTPTAAEMVEIFNPGPLSVDLTNYYLTDATFANGGTYYYNIVIGAPGGGSFGDFTARFPAGATIAPGEYQTIALGDANGAAGFLTSYGMLPTYECPDVINGINDPSVPDMLEAVPGSVNSTGGLTNSGEMVCLFYWDGVSDLVTDIDYVIYGDQDEAVDKTGVSIDGPDADSVPSTYLPDVAVSAQSVATAPSVNGTSAQRVRSSEGLELATGGNGVQGANEASENSSFTWANGAPTPGAPAPAAFALSWTDNGDDSHDVALSGGTSGGLCLVVLSFDLLTLPLPTCPGEALHAALGGASVVTDLIFDAAGAYSETIVIAEDIPGVVIQTVDVLACKVSNRVVVDF